MRVVAHDERGTIVAVQLGCDYCGASADVVAAQADGWGIVVRNLDATTETDVCGDCLAYLALGREDAGRTPAVAGVP